MNAMSERKQQINNQLVWSSVLSYSSNERRLLQVFQKFHFVYPHDMRFYPETRQCFKTEKRRKGENSLQNNSLITYPGHMWHLDIKNNPLFWPITISEYALGERPEIFALLWRGSDRGELWSELFSGLEISYTFFIDWCLTKVKTIYYVLKASSV